MQINNICVIGGSGFVGQHLCHRLAARGFRVRVPTRDRERAKRLTLLPTVDVVVADVHDPVALARVIRGSDVVINLVGVLHDARGSRGFDAAHVELARKVAAACKANGVRRVLHMSALAAAPDAPSSYLRSKGTAERLVLASGLDVTVFRPSVIFGPEDSFLNLFAGLARMLPVLALACPNARFQPVFVEDVAAAFVRALDDIGTLGRSYDLCGPKRYTLRELVTYVGRLTGHPRPVIGLNRTLSYCQAWAMELLPVKLMTRDNLRSMEIDSVCDCAFPFGIKPQSLEAVAPAWLAVRTPRARYQRFRDTAGR
ncbi:MAG: complex I NDUFA9 subunit family protein [Betaproteobacteria bacterium]|nr:complex I NDUFA9 subunit family protein [Betaproteobacteria bacterium]MDH5342578.1 complex I NDUFA9 subunit family protein [Betaproteobacteria bacterium]